MGGCAKQNADLAVLIVNLLGGLKAEIEVALHEIEDALHVLGELKAEIEEKR